MYKSTILAITHCEILDAAMPGKKDLRPRNFVLEVGYFCAPTSRSPSLLKAKPFRRGVYYFSSKNTCTAQLISDINLCKMNPKKYKWTGCIQGSLRRSQGQELIQLSFQKTSKRHSFSPHKTDNTAMQAPTSDLVASPDL